MVIAMTERERLIDLLECADVQKERKPPDMQEFYSNVAGYLLDNGVILPPVKVGDKVWRRGGYSFRVVEIDIHKNHTIFRCGNDGTDDYMAFDISDIGKTVFLTEVEAQSVLKELNLECGARMEVIRNDY